MTFADQRARTGLAWTRTLLGCTAVGMLTARAAWVSGTGRALVALPLLLAVTGVVVALGRARRLHAGTTAPAAPYRTVLAAAAVVVGLALLAAVFLVLP